MLTQRQRLGRIERQQKQVAYDGKVYPSQKAWGKAMGHHVNPSAYCAKHLKKGEYKGIKLERVVK